MDKEGDKGQGDTVTRGQGDKGTRRQGDKATRGQGDKGTRGQGDKGTSGQGDKGTRGQGGGETVCFWGAEAPTTSLTRDLSEKGSSPTVLGVIRPKAANAIGLLPTKRPQHDFPRDITKDKEVRMNGR